ncbi:hypothetical protein IPA_08435 [Ignicoccus pacificus DSM 13166]|uniref:Uncharacterized protein n=1 Tax=Ignicoccus pacificus DSM 13166 TaxID=940294 RepID=A0A977KBY2_9CREN|nr:hypothetical protein IPA_08435 [Ignicoccus pacificus DSM 13166]
MKLMMSVTPHDVLFLIFETIGIGVLVGLVIVGTIIFKEERREG